MQVGQAGCVSADDVSRVTCGVGPLTAGGPGGDLRVVGGQHGHRAGQDAHLVGGVVVEGAVPVEVVLGEIEHASGVRCEIGCPVQLEAGDLGGEDVDRRFGQQGLPRRGTDIAHGQCAAAVGGENRFQHGGGGRLAVGAGDRQPGAGRAEQSRLICQPGCLDVPDHRDPGVGGGHQDRTVRTPPRGCHHQVNRGEEAGGTGLLGGDQRCTGLPRQASAGLNIVVDHDDRGVQRRQHPGHPGTGDTGTGDDDPSATQGVHQTPTVHLCNHVRHRPSPSVIPFGPTCHKEAPLSHSL